jgi:hypothetical protein
MAKRGNQKFSEKEVMWREKYLKKEDWNDKQL